MSEEVRTVGYDFEQIVTISVFPLFKQQAGCSRESRAKQIVTKAMILFHENNTEMEFSFVNK